MYFTQDQVAELNHDHDEVRDKFADLRERYIFRNYQSAQAREHATHGFARRLGTLVRCIDNVFELLPPDREDIPTRNEVVDATINIQAFAFNIFGCCENLAWIWVSERPVLQDDGSPLQPKMIGLGSRRVRRSFSPPFRSYLNSRQRWFTHMKDFRDALAHRIPLYIPPYIVAPEHVDEYQRLEIAANEALRCGNAAEYHRLLANQEALSFYRPWMTHPQTENASIVVFHSQLLADFNTVDEIGRRLLREMED